jgi:hypothetical protein
MAYTDIGGLYQEWGLEQTVTHKGGEYRNNGLEREIEVRIDLTTLTEAETVLDGNIFFPVGMKITEIEILVETAAATGVAIDLGFIRTDRTTEIDYDGLLAAFVTATMTVGNKVVLRKGGTQAGAMVGSGVATTNVGHLTCSRTTATAFTAGVIKVTIRYERP